MNVKRFLPIIGLIILVYILFQFDFNRFFEVINQIPNSLLLLSLGSSIPIILISNVEWQYLLKKQHIKVSFFYSMKNILIGYFYGFITPGGIGGYIRAGYLSDKSNEPVEKCLYNICLLNTIDIITLFFISIIGAFLFSSIYPILFFTLLLLCIIWIILLILLIHQNTWIWIIKFIFRFTLFKKYHRWIQTSIITLQTNLPSKKHIFITIILSIIGWILRFTLFFLILMLFAITMSYIHVIFIIAIANIISMIPISIYGLGTRETVLISLFSIFSISPDIIIGISLFWFVLIWIIPSISGGILSLLEGKTKPIKQS